MRKMMSKEIVQTTLTVGLVTVLPNGELKADAKPELTFEGRLTPAQALAAAKEAYGENAQVFGSKETKEVYEASVEDFLKIAKIKEKEKEEY